MIELKSDILINVVVENAIIVFKWGKAIDD